MKKSFVAGLLHFVSRRPAGPVMRRMTVAFLAAAVVLAALGTYVATNHGAGAESSGPGWKIETGELTVPGGLGGQPSAPQALVALPKTEGFEGTWPNDWTLSGNPTWGPETCNKHSGAKSGWVARGGANGLPGCVNNYPNSMNSWMVYGPFDLSGKSAAGVNFWFDADSEVSFDWFYAMASGDQVNWSYHRFSGDFGGWINDYPFDLSPWLGDSSVWFAFRFTSDASITDVGAFVDDIEIWSTAGTVTPTPTPTPEGCWTGGPPAAAAGDNPSEPPREPTPTTEPGQLPDMGEDIGVRERMPPSPSDEAVPGELIVKFSPAVLESERGSVLRDEGAVLLRQLLVPGYALVGVPAGKEQEFIGRLQANPGVDLAEKSGIGRPTFVPNDPGYPLQWHMPQIQMEQAWDVANGSGVVVAVIDTGVAYENYGPYVEAPDLAGTSFTAGCDFINSDYHANDDQGHGTHVAGTIAQTTNNSLGVAGVAYGATIMPVKVCEPNGCPWVDVADGIMWATDYGADVINLSLTGSSASVLQTAINYALSNGVVVVAATGNANASSLGCPACYPGVMAVGATDYNRNRAPYSNYGCDPGGSGHCLDVVAPGGDVTVDANGDTYPDGVLQQTFEDTCDGIEPPVDLATFTYCFFQGTSMASPHVAGAAALLLDAYPSLTVQQVGDCLRNTAQDRGAAGYDTTYGWGLIQVRDALNAWPLNACTAGGLDLTLVKAASPADGASVSTGSTITYTLTTTNSATSTGTATNVPIRDTIGTGLTLSSVTPGTGVTCADTTAPEINCTAASIAPGQSRTVTVAVTVSATSGTVLNGGRVDPLSFITETNEDADDPDRDCTAVGEGTDAAPATEPDNFDCTGHQVVQPDLTITKASVPVDGGSVSPGSTITYTLTACNNGSGAASNVPIRDTIGTGLSLTSVTPGTGVTCSDTTPPEINCTAASMGSGECRTVTIPVMVTATSGTVLNGARVDPANVIAESNEDADDPDRDCSAVGEGTDVAPATEPDNFDCTGHPGVQPDLTITKASVPVDGGSVSPGSTITYTLTACNNGSGAASNVPIRDTLGAGLSGISVTPGSGVTCSDTTPPEINCTAASMAVGECRTVAIVATVSATSGTVLNGGRVDPANVIAESNEDADDPDRDCTVVGEGTDAAPATEPDNFDCTGHPVSTDLTITKASVPVDGSTVSTGQTITYTLSVSASGGAASNVAIRDTIGTGLSLTSVTPGSSVTCSDVTGPEINCTAASIASGSTVTVTVNTTVTATSGTVLNGARVDPANVIAETNEDADDPALDCTAVGEGSDVDPATEPDNFDCTSHSVGGLDLTITKTASPVDGSSVNTGTTITYTLSVSASGGAASNVAIRDTIGTGLSLTSVTPGSGVTCSDTAPPEINCTAASIASGSTVTVTVNTTVTATSGTVLNGARVDPANVIAETNEDADDPVLDCAAVGEGTDAADPTEPDNFDCTAHVFGAVLRIEPPVKTCYLSGACSVDILVENVTNLGSFEFILDFDPGVIQFDHFEQGSFLGSTGRTTQCSAYEWNPGSQQYGCATGGTQAGPNGSGVLAKAFFTPLTVDETALDLHNTALYDATDLVNPIPHTVQDGRLIVSACYGDVDGDGDVDIRDVALVFAHWPSPPLAYDSRYDMDGDLDIDIRDVGLVFGQWPKVCSL